MLSSNVTVTQFSTMPLEGTYEFHVIKFSTGKQKAEDVECQGYIRFASVRCVGGRERERRGAKTRSTIFNSSVITANLPRSGLDSLIFN